MSTKPLVPVVLEEEAQPPETPPAPRPRMTWEEIAAYAIVGARVLFVLIQHLVAAAVVGLPLYLILDRVSRRFQGPQLVRLGRSARRAVATADRRLPTADFHLLA
jgi:hypothetical protein